jgi:Rps23 Pro-64 3,4-dihydroxylase Tpa1-like proline 4-hydroxylase|tara:strand:+ start:860 stop:1369 length:510 start_codon:yes stop_codon:yes gene_type:complete
MELNGKIKYEDNFLSPEEFLEINQYCMDTEYRYGERDDDNLPPTGMINEIRAKEDFFGMLKKRLKEKEPMIKHMSFYRMYVNCFAPGENPYFHKDGRGITFLYYANMEWDLQNGGETQFYIDGNILGVPAIPNRLVMFDGMIPHRATSFRNGHRFTIAIKYQYNDTSYE